MSRADGSVYSTLLLSSTVLPLCSSSDALRSTLLVFWCMSTSMMLCWSRCCITLPLLSCDQHSKKELKEEGHIGSGFQRSQPRVGWSHCLGRTSWRKKCGRGSQEAEEVRETSHQRHTLVTAFFKLGTKHLTYEPVGNISHSDHNKSQASLPLE